VRRSTFQIPAPLATGVLIAYRSDRAMAAAIASAPTRIAIERMLAPLFRRAYHRSNFGRAHSPANCKQLRPAEAGPSSRQQRSSAPVRLSKAPYRANRRVRRSTAYNRGTARAKRSIGPPASSGSASVHLRAVILRRCGGGGGASSHRRTRLLFHAIITQNRLSLKRGRRRGPHQVSSSNECVRRT
jgi:hypothetical protein